LLHEGRLLLERRSDTGEWGLVGGAIEPGESVAQALFREIREETGLVLPARDGRAAVTDFALFGVYSDPTRIAAYADGTVRRIVSVAFKMDVADLSALRASDESLEIRLFARSELEAITIVATHREVVLDYLSGTSAPFIR
jgi:8-oxo-dGTP pyrophosphatase MutT (NUDIX family)